MGRHVVRGVLPHGAELENLKKLPIPADALLPKQHRAVESSLTHTAIRISSGENAPG